MSGSFENLALVVTYDCSLRCSYCPVLKSDRSMPFDVAKKGIDLFLSNGLKRIRIAGADPFKNLGVIKSILEYVDSSVTVRLTSNGVGLNEELISYFEKFSNLELVFSIDGDRETQLLMRKSASKGEDSFSWFEKYSNRLSKLQNLAHVNVVVSPQTVIKLVGNIGFLAKHGFFRFNILPAYYVYWNDEQINLLKNQFNLLVLLIKKGLEKDLPFYIVNLDNFSPVSLFRQEFIVDVDGNIYDNDVICSRMVEKDKSRFSYGNVLELENVEKIKSNSSVNWNDLIDEYLGEVVANSTKTVDAELSRFVEQIERFYK